MNNQNSTFPNYCQVFFTFLYFDTNGGHIKESIPIQSALYLLSHLLTNNHPFDRINDTKFSLTVIIQKYHEKNYTIIHIISDFCKRPI